MNKMIFQVTSDFGEINLTYAKKGMDKIRMYFANPLKTSDFRLSHQTYYTYNWILFNAREVINVSYSPHINIYLCIT